MMAQRAGRFPGGSSMDSGGPVPGVKVTVEPYRKPEDKAAQMVLRTDGDGHYSGMLPPDHKASITFEREGYSTLTTGAHFAQKSH